jgi:hypothetical protein
MYSYAFSRDRFEVMCERGSVGVETNAVVDADG